MGARMKLRLGLAKAIVSARKSKGITQEDFSNVSSRTYVSSLERGLKSPTIDKLDELCGVLEVHPVSMLLAAYLLADSNTLDGLQNRIKREVSEIVSVSNE